jgi:RNA polymerase sigma-70 factor, ECF subfamily
MDNELRRHLEARQFPEAFDLLVAQFREKVFRLAFSLLHNETQAEDAAQEVFLKIWKALPACRADSSLSSWVYTITRNTCLTELKKRSTHATVSLHDPVFEDAADRLPALQTIDPASGVELDIQTMLAQLPEKYRQVITLFYLEQKAYEETAALLGIPLGTVKTLLFRARKELLRIASRSGPVTSVANTVPPRPSSQVPRVFELQISPLHAPTQG